MRSLVGANPSNEPAIIASNPLYGLVDFFRGVGGSEPFISGRVAKVSVRLAVLDRKAAELLKMRSVAPDNVKMLSKAVNEYQRAVYQYAFAAAPLAAADISSDPRAEEFIDSVVNSTLTHVRLIDELLSVSTKNTEQAVLGDMLDTLADASAKAFAGAIGTESIRVRLVADSEYRGITMVRNAEALALLAKNAATLGHNAVSQELLSMRLAILNIFAPQLTHETTLSEFSQLVGSRNERIQTISYLLSLPELSQNSDLINLRNQLLIQVFSK